jgi:hypothetical protein
MWTKPQAVMWSRLGLAHELALFCRNLAAAEAAGAPVMLQTVVLRQLESLGLSVAGMQRHRWLIEAEAKVDVTSSAPAAKPRKSSRSRLKVVGVELGEPDA